MVEKWRNIELSSH